MHDVAIVGAGCSGLGMAIKLLQDGRRDFVVLERSDDVGGTWWANTYPGMDVAEVRADAQAAFNADVERRLDGTVWTSGGCTSWYLDDKGRDTVQWPGATWRFRRLMSRFDPGVYELAA